MRSTAHLDTEACYRVVQSRDRRFDGVFYTAVRSTGIYCRPSCPARTPARGNVTFHATAASAHMAGYRACKRCRPDATPGSPEWDVAADVAGRAMRLIADGIVDREGVDGLARRLGYTTRHLARLLGQELGATPLALARARRAQSARVLIESTDLSATDVAFAAGFTSVRQFNETFQEIYAATPRQMRGQVRGSAPTGSARGTVTMRLPVRTPYDGRALAGFLATRAVPGVEVLRGDVYARTMRLPNGHGTVELTLPTDLRCGETTVAHATFSLTDLRDLGAASERTRRLLDADCDPVAVILALGEDELLGPIVRSAPGLRVPGHVDGDELAVRAVLGQQVTVAGARTMAGRFVENWGEPVHSHVPGLTHLFPTAERLAELDPCDLPMPRVRARALIALCAALVEGDVVLDRGSDRDDVRASLMALPGIGSWTADYIAMRALGHPNVFLSTDLGVRHGLAALGLDPEDADELSQRWRPWRSYAQVHLWHTLSTSKET